VGGADGWASGHRGIMVELEDGMVAPNEDPQRLVTRSSSAAAKLNGARGFTCTAMTYGERRE
jgi:hypothetical protein